MLCGAVAADGMPVPARAPPEGPLGLHTSYFQEPSGPLSLEQARAANARGAFVPSRRAVLNFGIGARPAWVHFRVANVGSAPLARRLSIETPWLDRVDVFVRHGGQTVATFRLGDHQPHHLRPVDSRHLALQHAFSPGVSEVFLRIQTPDPMAVPIYLLTPRQAHAREQGQTYSYGFLYGFLFALLAYNAMLYSGLRHPRYILYSVYLGMFLLMNIAYTGHGFQWLWPAYPQWAQWANPLLMVLYGSSGLIFALAFLDTRRLFPRLHRSVVIYVGLSLALLLAAMLAGSQRYALQIAFTFVSLFTAMMLLMGIMALRSGEKPARYFLLAAVAAMLGAASTALSVWGFIPYNTWTFRAVEIGILLDATLLALALTYQFRVGQAEKLQAQQLARLDPLTGLNNRRAFYDKVVPLWNLALRHDHDLSIVLLDLDRFKRINDVHGHACGDRVLAQTAAALRRVIRGQDVLARWGGEEFILLLPQTDRHEAAALAERLRQAVAAMRPYRTGSEITVTASFGVAQRESQHRSLDALISSADKQLYLAKHLGRNRVHADSGQRVRGPRGSPVATPEARQSEA